MLAVEAPLKDDRQLAQMSSMVSFNGVVTLQNGGREGDGPCKNDEDVIVE